MSTKFEQLLDYLVNEEHDKANELFHEIVVEKSRSIYENLIAEEEDEETDESKEEMDDESVDEFADDEDEEMDESREEDEEMDESSEELEDSYMMDADDGFSGGAEGDASDEFGTEIGADDEEDHEADEDSAIMDIKNAIAELEAAFAELEQAQSAETGSSEFDDHDDEETDEMMGTPAMEGRRITREYTETVGNDWDKNSQKGQGQIVGANTGEKMPTANDTKSAINTNADKTKPTSGANAKNLVQGQTGEGGSNTGTSPNKVNKGITPEKGEHFAKGIHNVDGQKSGVKTLSKVAGGHGAEKKGGGEGQSVGAGTGGSSVTGSTNTKSIVDKKIG